MRRFVLAGLLMTVFATSAHAAGGNGSFALVGGYGTDKVNFGFGPGIRFGMGAEPGYYMGAIGQYFLGSNSGASSGNLLLGAELGYNYLGMSDFTMRPYVGFGVIGQQFGWWPGMMAIMPAGDSMFFGFDFNYKIIPNGGSPVINAVLGFKI